MCGIAGLWRVAGAQEDLERTVRQMTDAIRHRGPDDSGVWSDPSAGLGLGHRRLAIIDLSPAGHQPMQDAGGRYVLTFNGEIYNYRELRAEESAHGAEFRGHSDTEVLLARIARVGLPETLRAARGMFALALWDRETRRLDLARDRIGEKPLAFVSGPGWFAFASEHRAFWRVPGFRPGLSRDGVATYLQWGYSRGPGSVLADVRKLAPGAILTVTTDGTGWRTRETRYWTLPTAPAPGANADEATCVDELDALLRRVIERQMISDVPLGAFLSGGIDSSLVVAIMQASRSTPTRTFTIAFPESSHDEAPFALEVARALGTDHEAVELGETELLNLIPRLPEIYDEPFGDTSAIPTALLSALTRRHVSVSLSGDGGDELFGGYRTYLQAERWAGRLGRIPRPWRGAAAAALRHVPLTVAGRAGGLGGWWTPDRIRKGAELLAFTDLADLHERIRMHWRDPEMIVPGGRARMERWVPADPAGEPLRELLRTDMASYLPDDIFYKVDRAAMAVALETRAPFVDADVVAFASQLPSAHLFRAGKGKSILRTLLARYLPVALFERPKRGFSAPVGRWLRGPLRQWADDLLAPARLARSGVLAAGPIRAMWGEHLAGARNWQYLLWDVLMLQQWLDAQPTPLSPSDQ